MKEDFENRLDNLTDTMAYRHEIKALEDVVHIIKIKTDAAELTQKETDKKFYDLTGSIKKKVDFTLYLK